MHRTSGALLLLLLGTLAAAPAHWGQARAAPTHHAAAPAFTVLREAAAHAAAGEHIAVSALTAGKVGRAQQHTASTAAGLLADAAAGRSPSAPERLGAASDGASVRLQLAGYEELSLGSVSGDEPLSADAFESAPAAGAPDLAVPQVALERSISEAAATQLQPQLGRLQVKHPDVRVTLSRGRWPPRVAASGRQWAAVDAALNSTRIVAYRRSEIAGEAKSEHGQQLRLAMSRRELNLLGLEYIGSEELLAELQDLYNVSLKAQPPVMVIYGTPDLAAAAAAEMQHVLAYNRVQMGLTRPLPAWFTAGVAPGRTPRTIDVPPAAAGYLATPRGAQALRHIKDQLELQGVCCGYFPAQAASTRLLRRYSHAMAAASDSGVGSASIFLANNEFVELAEDRLRRWLAWGTPGELEAFRPSMQDGMAAAEGFGAGPAAELLLPGPEAQGGGSGWDELCAEVLGERSVASLGSWLRDTISSIDPYLLPLYAVCTIHLLAALALGWTAFIVFGRQRGTPGGAAAQGVLPECERRHCRGRCCEQAPDEAKENPL